ncbi:MAG: DsrE family protein [Rhodobacteraceae bacterium]|nr:DsrE family protein [Paracoccaceae bacterium]
MTFLLGDLETLLNLPREQGGRIHEKARFGGGFALAAGSAAWAETHHIAVHVNQNDPQVMTMALNNVQNLTNYYESQGDDVVVEVVAYGPGLNMLIPGKSPVAERIETMALAMHGLTFSACGNTHRAMSAKLGQEVALLDEARIVPSGVVRLVELQEQGFAYVRP